MIVRVIGGLGRSQSTGGLNTEEREDREEGGRERRAMSDNDERNDDDVRRRPRPRHLVDAVAFCRSRLSFQGLIFCFGKEKVR